MNKMKILLFWISLFYSLSLEPSDFIKLNLYGQKQISGQTYLYLPLEAPEVIMGKGYFQFPLTMEKCIQVFISIISNQMI